MIHSEDKEGIIIADKLTRVAVDRRIRVASLLFSTNRTNLDTNLSHRANRD